MIGFDSIAEDVVQKLFDRLLKVVLEVKRNVEMFESVLQSMESTLKSIIPDVERIDELNKRLHRQDDVTMNLWTQIRDADKLVLKCSKVNCWSCFKKHRCVQELIKLDNSLKRFCQIVVQVRQTRYIVEIMEELNRLFDMVTRLWNEIQDIRKALELLNQTRTHSTASLLLYMPPETPEFAVGFKVEESSFELQATEIYQEEVTGTQENPRDIQDLNNVSSHPLAPIEPPKFTIGSVEVASLSDKEKDRDKKTSHDEKGKHIHEKVKDIDMEVKNVSDIQTVVKEIHEGMKKIRELLQLLNPIKYLRPGVPPEPLEVTVGLDEPLRKLKKELLLKDGVSAVVLCGPGGCGKTTLAKKLCRDAEVEGKFEDNIFFVIVSKTPNLKVIIQQLFLHKGCQVPEFQSDRDAVNHLEQLLRQIGPKPILLVLDDVWAGFLLDKFKFQMPNYKILVTSRSAFPRFGSTYNLHKLNNEDSMSLFRCSAGLQDGSSYCVDEEVVNKVVKACKELPLALTIVGRSLCGQPAEIWQNQVTKWSKEAPFHESNVEPLSCLRSTLDALKYKVVKECYMDLGLFPEGQLIPVTALIDMWVELYELDEDGLNSIVNLYLLSALNLVNLVVTRQDAIEIDGCYNEHFVMQHDLLSEMVNHVSRLDPVEQRKRITIEISENEFPKWWMEQRKQNISARLLSISTDETFSSNWFNIEAPEVQVLILNFCSQKYALPQFMRNMDKLKALIITNYGFSPAEINNLSLFGYLSNLKRTRLEKVLIPSLTLTSTRLKNLQKLSLHMCNMSRDFGNSNIKISDALPNLVEINISYCNNLMELPVGLCDILCLKKLIITFCHELSLLPEEIGKLVNLEVLRVSSCIKLIKFPDTIGSLHKLSILDISNCISIRKLPEQIGGLQTLRKLYMTGCSKCELPKSIINLGHLEHVICDEETIKLWEPFRRYFSNLKMGY